MKISYKKGRLLCSVVCLATLSSLATLQRAKLVHTENGEASSINVLTNGAVFVVGDVTYKLEIDQTEEQTLLEKLDAKGAPLRFDEIPVKEAFTMLTHMSGMDIVCARSVDQTVPVSINSQNSSIRTVLEQVCFQIDADFKVKNKTIWVSSTSTAK